MTQARRALGAQGEEAVAAWYQARGYEVVERNWRCRAGELDLILRRGRTFVFCEVKVSNGHVPEHGRLGATGDAAPSGPVCAVEKATFEVTGEHSPVAEVVSLR